LARGHLRISETQQALLLNNCSKTAVKGGTRKVTGEKGEQTNIKRIGQPTVTGGTRKVTGEKGEKTNINRISQRQK
jgi:hypothetical protein